MKNSTLSIKALILMMVVAGVVGVGIAKIHIWLDPVSFHNQISDKKCCLLIDHALGTIGGKTHSNSIEALNHNIENGDRVFEVDLKLTSDGKWALIHDWNYNNKVAPTYADFRKLRHPGYTPATIEDLERVAIEHPDVLFALDVKEDLIASGVYDYLTTKTTLGDNLLWMAFNIEQIDYLQAKGMHRVMLTTYRMKIPDAQAFVQNLNNNYADKIIGVSMPTETYLADQASFDKLNFPIYLYGKNVNSLELQKKLQHKVAGFYLDRGL